MANFFYTDANGQKTQVTEQQLQTLINRGIITPTTPLETDGGHTGLAGQIPCLNFDTVAPSPFAQPTQAIPKKKDKRHPNIRDVAWFDFSFLDIRLLGG